MGGAWKGWLMGRLAMLILAASALVGGDVRAAPVVGTLDVIGSDTLAGLMMRWGEQFERRYPGVRLQLQATGSATAPPALAQGTTRIGAMSRRMTDAERADFIARRGYAPTALPVALDALAVFVHRDNPLDAISLSELDALFSDTRRCGEPRAIDRWGALGLDGPWRERPITRHGRNSASGTYGLFKRVVLCHGDFRPDVNQYPGSAAVVAAVGESLGGIGYSGMGYLTAAVKPLALIDADGRAVPPSLEAAREGRYPLTRPLLLYVDLDPEAPLAPLERAFLDLVLSRDGQARVVEAGFVPLPEAQRRAWRRRLGLPRERNGAWESPSEASP
ncbi:MULTISPECIES: phosphate ABC transporter substrate-binding protein [unclassified Modicisalibacter]|uniref:PstS family phosphate ABC transporter substrate-binding protein n=1 Tax=unclassified Modicisalibacter TaxID=2679913 RepID=UPI001CC9D5EF|nr:MULTISPECIES: phosphate ABC transporter substrate-binding protein [unclassified Modicisalibacter]MBZ9558635.1 phosphate ABC transporter substrate-binding protein [Modicisalibacter sp. R2A 31.J]MBZ9575473.1 phosphate ABC transporter substrate-binding protein [Modicisalibacter sp. MOD 31.J]